MGTTAAAVVEPSRVCEAGEGDMGATTGEITWRHDFEAALGDAQQQHRTVLLDFSAAPM
jgi:hypothetical protein